MDSDMWAFVAFALPTLLALACGAMQMNREHPRDFVIARVCFWLSGLIPAFAVYWWLCHQPLTLVIHACATFILTLMTGLLTGALLKWVNEREKHCTSDPPPKAQVGPTNRFKIEVGPNLITDNIWELGPVRFLQAKITIQSGTVHGCRAYLTEITGEMKDWSGNEQLTFSPSEASDSLSKAIYANVPYLLDVLVVTSAGDVVVCNQSRKWLRLPRLQDLFGARGSYDLTVVIAGEDATAEQFQFRFERTGNWQTCLLHPAYGVAGAPDESSGGYSTLNAIAERALQFPQQPRPELNAQFVSIIISGVAGGTGITVRLEIRNAGTPSIADKFTATLSSGGSTYELFPAPMPPHASYADETGEMKLIKPSDTLYEKLRKPIPSGDRVRGFLFYLAKGVSPAQLTASEPAEIVIRFRDVKYREYTVASEGMEALYPPGVIDQFALEGAVEHLESDKLPANRIHMALDRLYELGREGEAMLERLKHNQEPIPKSKDVDAWANKLASIASSVGSYGEKTSFKVHYRHLGLPPAVLDVAGVPAPNAELAKSIQAKLSLKTALTARLLREDMLKELMPPT